MDRQRGVHFLLWALAVAPLPFSGDRATFGLRPAGALETDQFTVPPKPLADVGPELADEVSHRIDKAVARLNTRAANHAAKAARESGFWRRHHLRAAAAELSEGALVREVYRELAGPGLPECKIERWVRKHRFQVMPSRQEMTCGKGAYGASPFGRSLFLMELSPTVNVYGVYCGVDKIGHLFQQGYDYFKVFIHAESRGKFESDALKRAVREGVGQERGFFGLLLVGVYSNADLAANYAGLKFYLNLTREVRVGTLEESAFGVDGAKAGRVRPPLFVVRDGQWQRNSAESTLERVIVASPDGSPGARAAAVFLRPFVSDHFNEALNPSLYNEPNCSTVRRRWASRGRAWVAFYGTSREREVERLAGLATWHGESYGHSGFSKLVTAVNTCFQDAEDEVGQVQDSPPVLEAVSLRR